MKRSPRAFPASFDDRRRTPARPEPAISLHCYKWLHRADSSGIKGYWHRVSTRCIHIPRLTDPSRHPSHLAEPRLAAGWGWWGAPALAAPLRTNAAANASSMCKHALGYNISKAGSDSPRVSMHVPHEGTVPCASLQVLLHRVHNKEPTQPNPFLHLSLT